MGWRQTKSKKSYSASRSLHQARDGRYLAVGLANRYLTVIFEYEKGTANIVTSYPSSEWQVRLFKRGKRRR